MLISRLKISEAISNPYLFSQLRTTFNRVYRYLWWKRIFQHFRTRYIKCIGKRQLANFAFAFLFTTYGESQREWPLTGVSLFFREINLPARCLKERQTTFLNSIRCGLEVQIENTMKFNEMRGEILLGFAPRRPHRFACDSALISKTRKVNRSLLMSLGGEMKNNTNQVSTARAVRQLSKHQ